jgi:hypothetical protein
MTDRPELLRRLAVVERRVRAAVAERRRTDPDPDDAFRGLYLSDGHVDRLLDPVARSAPGWEAAPAEEGTRLYALAVEFGLSGFDLDVLTVALAPDLDPRFEKLYGYLHDDVSRRRASVGLAIELAGGAPHDQAARRRFDPAAPLARGGLLAVEDPDRPFLTRALRVPDRVTSHLLGSAEVAADLRAVVRDPPPLAAPEGTQLARAVAAGVRLVYCRQPPGAWCQTMAAGALGADALVVDLSQAGSDLLRTAVREARLLGRVLVAGPVDTLDPATVREATGAGARVVLFGTLPWDPAWADTGALGLDLHDLAHRRAEPGRPELAAFRLTPDQVGRAVEAARGLAAAEGPAEGHAGDGTESAEPAARHLRAGARMQNSGGLGRLARRVEPAAGWPDLVLPPLAVAGLRHLTDRVRWRDRVLGDWRLRRGGARGEGVTALFCGEPGTGKTMAAEVVAADLGLDLYVIDLSTVVDKYVGETEKNLERVFTGAEGVNGVLFFDEADALFGKRSEVSDARDRYANLEVAYLLQRMESFDGLAVLATNLRANLDEAFARRLSMVVEFARPQEAERRQLWRRSLAAVPLAADVDLDFCASAFELAGGDIRNIAVTAAYLAAADGGVADMRWLMRAVRVEYRKLGRLCVEAEFGPYYHLLQEVPA